MITKKEDGSFVDDYGRSLVPYVWTDPSEPDGSVRKAVPSIRVVEDGHDAGSVHAHWDVARGFYETNEQMAARAVSVFTPHWHTVHGHFVAHHFEDRDERDPRGNRTGRNVKSARFVTSHEGWNLPHVNPAAFDPEDHAKKVSDHKTKLAVAAMASSGPPMPVVAPPIPAKHWDKVAQLVREHGRQINHSHRARNLTMPNASPKFDPTTGEAWIELTFDYTQKETHHVKVEDDHETHLSEMSSRLPRRSSK